MFIFNSIFENDDHYTVYDTKKHQLFYKKSDQEKDKKTPIDPTNGWKDRSSIFAQSAYPGIKRGMAGLLAGGAAGAGVGGLAVGNPALGALAGGAIGLLPGGIKMAQDNYRAAKNLGYGKVGRVGSVILHPLIVGVSKPKLQREVETEIRNKYPKKSEDKIKELVRNEVSKRLRKIHKNYN